MKSWRDYTFSLFADSCVRRASASGASAAPLRSAPSSRALSRLLASLLEVLRATATSTRCTACGSGSHEPNPQSAEEVADVGAYRLLARARNCDGRMDRFADLGAVEGGRDHVRLEAG